MDRKAMIRTKSRRNENKTKQNNPFDDDGYIVG